MYVAQPIEWTDHGVVMLDQRRLPSDEIHHTYTDYREVAKAIRDMVIRGAPAIGVAAAMGVALGVIRVAFEQGRKLHVLVPETRPYLQGARLTAWELHRGGIPLTLITDNMVGHFMKTGKVGAVVTGADRIAANGDSANKIGTYQIAVLAKENNVPFYIAAPVSTFDLSIPDGDHIPIEERSAAEVTHLKGLRIAPDVPAANPAFDVTPARYIVAIFTERGVARAAYKESLRALAEVPQQDVA